MYDCVIHKYPRKLSVKPMLIINVFLPSRLRQHHQSPLKYNKLIKCQGAQEHLPRHCVHGTVRKVIKCCSIFPETLGCPSTSELYLQKMGSLGTGKPKGMEK